MAKYVVNELAILAPTAVATYRRAVDWKLSELGPAMVIVLALWLALGLFVFQLLSLGELRSAGLLLALRYLLRSDGHPGYKRYTATCPDIPSAERPPTVRRPLCVSAVDSLRAGADSVPMRKVRGYRIPRHRDRDERIRGGMRVVANHHFLGVLILRSR
jgi:hypothetical protein